MKQQHHNHTCHRYPYYTLKKRAIVLETGLFKIKDFDDSHVMFAAPDAKCIIKTDCELNGIAKCYNFNDRPSALDIVELGSKKFIAAGFHRGDIIIRPADDNNENKQEEQNQNQKEYEWKFSSVAGQNYVNDIAHHPENPSVIVNCYNNGSLTVWGLISNRKIHTFQKVHEKYTYKLRFQTPNVLISCGADCNVIGTDLQKQKFVSFLNHPLPVWCAYPIDQNLIASVGLFYRVLVWDVRVNRIVQYCNNIGSQSSFITTRNPNQMKLFYGDSSILAKWDRRKAKSQLLSKHMMQVSSQELLFKDDKLYACGRGRDLCLLEGSNTLQNMSNAQDKHRTFIFKLSSESNPIQLQMQDIEDQDDQEQEVVQNMGSQMQDQSQPLLEMSKKQKIERPIDKVAQLSIEQFKRLKNIELKWIQIEDNQQQDEQSEQNVNTLKEQYNIMVEVPKNVNQHQQQK